MNKELKKRLSVLDPRFKKQIQDLFSNINESVSLLYETATRDEKTGLYNNKFFDNILDMELEKAKRGKEKLSLIEIDIDFFKKINDTYGHIKADDLLAVLARVIQKQIRKSDIAARFGGEEFFILLPETSIIKAEKVASRLKDSIHKNPRFKEHNVTVSGGITQFKKRDSKKTFKIRADKALYKAKQTGRDKFVAIK